MCMCVCDIVKISTTSLISLSLLVTIEVVRVSKMIGHEEHRFERKFHVNFVTREEQ